VHPINKTARHGEANACQAATKPKPDNNGKNIP